MFWVKGAAPVMVIVAAWQGWERFAHSLAIELAVAAAGVAGAGVLWKKVVLPAWVVLRKIDEINDAVRALPDWMREREQWRRDMTEWQAEIERRLAAGSAEFDHLEGQLRLLVSADRQRISDALEALKDPRGRQGPSDRS